MNGEDDKLIAIYERFEKKDWKVLKNSFTRMLLFRTMEIKSSDEREPLLKVLSRCLDVETSPL